MFETSHGEKHLTFCASATRRWWHLSQSVLSHCSGSGITRHIGSQVANPKRFYSNPVPWLGPLRRNQLAFNMREKLALELDIVIARDPDMVCRRTFLSQGDSKCITETSDRNDYVGDARPSSGTRCPQKPGAQQPVAVAVPSLAVQASVARVQYLCGCFASGAQRQHSTSCIACPPP